jgi:predicted nucleic acid-binding protein
LTGDISTHDDTSTLTMLYNKNLYKFFEYENPYELVQNGKWTLDKMSEMIKGVNQDLNGDGIIDENDRWGMASEEVSLYYLFFGSGRGFIEKTDGKYGYMLENPRIVDILNKTFNLLTSPDSIYELNSVIKTKSVSVYETLEKMFMEDRLLFNLVLVGNSLSLRNMDGDFGFLPCPKYDELQEEYYSWITWHALTAVMPNIASDIEKSGLITEALAYESMFTIREPFYGNLLNIKIARDDEDVKMLNLILNSKAYDLDSANVVSGINSGVFNMMWDILSKREFTVASSWEKIKGSAEGKLEKFLEAFE